MCVPGCHETVMKRLSRRGFLQSAAAIGVAAGASACSVTPAPKPTESKVPSRSFTKAVDLSHVLDEKFPTYTGKKSMKLKSVTKLKKDGYTTNEWTLFEHIGTHLDAPIHFSDGTRTADQIPVSDLVVPLVVIDIREKANYSADAQVTPEDIKAFESRYGEIPQNACVAMLSGWDSKVSGKEFRNADSKGVMHFPGFHVEAAKYLSEQRTVSGIAVDTLSLDYGQSKDFATHYHWLPTNRWGLECVANLAQLPPIGATLVVGAPAIRGATGGPSRVIALV